MISKSSVEAMLEGFRNGSRKIEAITPEEYADAIQYYYEFPHTIMGPDFVKNISTGAHITDEHFNALIRVMKVCGYSNFPLPLEEIPTYDNSVSISRLFSLQSTFTAKGFLERAIQSKTISPEDFDEAPFDFLSILCRSMEIDSVGSHMGVISEFLVDYALETDNHILATTCVHDKNASEETLMKIALKGIAPREILMHRNTTDRVFHAVSKVHDGAPFIASSILRRSLLVSVFDSWIIATDKKEISDSRIEYRLTLDRRAIEGYGLRADEVEELFGSDTAMPGLRYDEKTGILTVVVDPIEASLIVRERFKNQLNSRPHRPAVS